MRIPLPERIPYQWATAFATGLLGVELFERTEPIFAFCAFAYVLVATAAFNLAGGLRRIGGAFVFFNATLGLLLGLVVKAVLGEPAHTHLLESTRSIEVYLLGMVGMLAAAFLESRLRSKRPPLIPAMPLDSDLRPAFIGSAVIGVLLALYFFLVSSGVESGSVASIINQINFFLPFALLLGTISTIRSSNGRRSMTLPLLGLFLFSTAEGLLSFSKQALFSPLVCWLLAAAVCRFRLKLVNWMVLAALGYVAVSYGTPYSQYGRTFQAATLRENIPVSIYLIEHIDEVKEQYELTSREGRDILEYYDQPMGLFDRLQMLTADDRLIAVTDREGLFGLEPLKEGFENLIPHFIWKDKPTPYFGNVYAHQIGILADEDYSTGISFGITADAYHMAGLVGVLLIEPVMVFGMFLLLSRVFGDISRTPLTLLFMLTMAHVGPESSLWGLLSIVTVTEGLLLIALVSRFVLPVVGSAFLRARVDPERARPTLLPARP